MLAPLVEPDLTDLQLRIYAYLCDYWRRDGQAPTQLEVRRATRCSTTALNRAYRALRSHGHITAPKYAVRGAEPVDLDRRIVRYPPDPWDSLGDD